MISVAEALARVLASASPPMETEMVTVENALGRTLARDLHALRTQPPFANSAMDGYALRGADTTSVPVRLMVIGESAAGRAFNGAVGANQAVRIFTGAPMPKGADSVLVQENASRDGDFLIVKDSETPGRHVRDAGIDFIEGELLLSAGRRLTPRSRRPPIIPPSQCAADRGSPCSRRGMSSCRRAKRSGRRRSSRRTIMQSPRLSPKAAAFRSILALPPTNWTPLRAVSVARTRPRPTFS
jgi:hypothetical protein